MASLSAAALSLALWSLVSTAMCEPLQCQEGQACDAEGDDTALLVSRTLTARRPKGKSGYSLSDPDEGLLRWDKMATVENYTFFNGWLKVPLSHEDARELPESELTHTCLRVTAAIGSKQKGWLGAMLLHCGGPGSGRECVLGKGLEYPLKGLDFAFLSINQRGVADTIEAFRADFPDFVEADYSKDCPFKESDGRPVRPFPELVCDELYKQLSSGMDDSAADAEKYKWQVERAKKILQNYMGDDEPAPTDEDIRIVFAILRHGGLPVDSTHGVTYLYEQYIRWYYRLVQLEDTLCTNAKQFNSWETKNGLAYNLFRYSGTEDLVQDLDVLRRALGEEKLSLYGLSYGTSVASAYATLFPEHTDRLILDGVIPPLLTTETLPEHQQQGFSSVYQAIFTDCSGSLYRSVSPEERCPLAPNPSSKVEKMIRDKEDLFRAAAVAGMLEELANSPLGCNDNSCINQAPVAVACVAELYGGTLDRVPGWCKKKATKVSEAQRDDAPLGPKKDRFKATQSTIQSAVIGLDAPGRFGEEALVQRWKEQVDKYPLGLRHYIEWTAPLSSWPIYPKPLPAAGQAQSRPLVIGNLHDQATDYNGAQLMRQAFPSGAIMTYQGFGHCLTTTPLDGPKPLTEQGIIRNNISLNHCHEFIVRYLKTMELPIDGHTCKLYSPLDLGSAAADSLLRKLGEI